MLLRRTAALFLPLALGASALPACVTDDDKGEEGELPEDGKLDSFRMPTNHGAIGFEERVTSELTAAEMFHTWDFTLSGDAAVTLTTSKFYNSSRKVDTVLYLYKEGPSGWGPYIARNDDYNGTVFSQLVRSLGAGHYRALVKGYTASTYGKFGLRATCSGAGCAPVVEDACLLGATYGDFRDSEQFTTTSAAVWTSPDGRTPLELDQIVLAVQQSAHTDVTTAAEAFERVQEGEINVTERTGFQHQLVAYEYGSGDNSYGAVFYAGTLELAASIRDGDLYECTLRTPQGGSALGETCAANSDCPSGAGIACRGIAGEVGVCASTADVPGEDAACTTTADCAANLFCAGYSHGGGTCMPAWQLGTFAGTTTGALTDAGDRRDHLTAYGLATVDTDVVLHAAITHAAPAQLKVYLRNPIGTENLAWDGATAGQGAGSFTLDVPVGFSGDEPVNGTWTLRIADGTTGGTGSLTAWSLTIGSRWD